MAGILYVQFWYAEPDWDGATTEQTDFQLFASLFIYVTKRCYIYNFVHMYFINPSCY